MNQNKIICLWCNLKPVIASLVINKLPIITNLQYLNKKPRSNKGKSAVLTIKPVMVCIKCKMVQVEEPEKKKKHRNSFTSSSR